MIDPHLMSESEFLQALGRGEWSPSARRRDSALKPVRARAVRALTRARRALAQSRRLRDEALRGLADVLDADLRTARAARRQEAAAPPPQDRTHELEKELEASQEAVANLVRRVSQERRYWKAALLTDRRRLLARRPDGAGDAGDRRRKAAEAELAAEQEAVANLMSRIMRERRRWRAEILAVRRHLLKLKRNPSPEAVRKLTAVESELEQSREACANLMVQLSAQKRKGQARLVGMERGARRGRKGGAAAQAKVPVAAAPRPPASSLGESLRRLAEAPTEEPPPVAEASRSKARGVILTALAAAPPRPSSGDLRAALARRLSVWDAAFRARRFTIISPDGPGWPAALFEGSVLQTMLDELLSFLLERMPRAGTLVVKGGRPEGGGLFVEFLCGGAAATPAALAGEAGLPLVRALAEAWGGGLEIDAGPRGRGTRVRLRLAGD